MKILIVGSGAREHAIARSLSRSQMQSALFCVGESKNPGIHAFCTDYSVLCVTDTKSITAMARGWKIDFAIIGPEAPLEAGIVDELLDIDIPSVGPTKQLAQIETSKSFARDLLTHYGIPGCPKYKNFTALEGAQEYLEALSPNYVVKADGLMGGKGVRVAGDHLNNTQEAVEYCKYLVAQGNGFVIEEKLIGQEFSLMSFCDGEHLSHMPPVQDHKRAFIDDKGPNTGGMGSYSNANHLLPFLTDTDVKQAQEINQLTANALKDKFGIGFKGILYGGFMVTAEGLKLIEYNARFGDPEAINVLSLLETDFTEICHAVIDCTLDKQNVRFKNLATVCKYAVPEGYPDNPVKGEKIDISNVHNKNNLYLGAVDAREDGIYETGSRTIAVVGIGKTIAEAEAIAEKEISRVKGPLYHRKDIGTHALIEKRVEMMNKILKLAILGSTRGTDMEAIIQAIVKKKLSA